MEKLFFGFISILCSIFILTSCTMFGGYKGISSYDDLNNISEGTNIKLENDIDCKNQPIKVLKCGKFDGNGYTLKNIYLSGSDDISLFYEKVEEVKNVVIDNLNIVTKSGLNACAMISCGSGRNDVIISDVTIKNSKLDCTFTKNTSYQNYDIRVGGILAGGVNGSLDLNQNYSESASIERCKLENVEISVVMNKRDANLFIGGITGFGSLATVNDCSVLNSKINVKGTSAYTDLYVGGISGVNTTISNCYLLDTEVKAENTSYVSNMLGYYSTPTVFVGGISAYSNKTTQFSYVSNSTMEASSSGEAYCGSFSGLVKSGSVMQSYVANNKAEISGYNSNNADTVKRRVGGFIGSISEGSSITSCFAYNNKVVEQAFSTKSSNSYSGGFSGRCINSTIDKCAVNVEEIIGENIDIFVNDILEGSECYTDTISYTNINNYELIPIDFWNDAIEIKEKLKLLGNLWDYDEADHPILKL